MAFNYQNSRATAERLIANFGQNVTLVKITSDGASYSPSVSETSYTVVAVDLNETNRNAPGSLNEKTTRMLLISTSAGVVPETNDRVTIDGETHTLGMVKPFAPGGVKVLHEAEIID